VRENLDYVVWFTLVWSTVVGVMVAVVVGVFLFIRRRSLAETRTRQKAQGPRLRD
jgi:MFS superfamily sulfate permease-like transporter